MITARLESMSPDGCLELYRQEDGDIILTIAEGHERGGIKRTAAVEFCTPGAGGGGSSRTWAALVQLMGAMAADNLDAAQSGRRPPGDRLGRLVIDDDEQRRLVEWAAQCRQADDEMQKLEQDFGVGGHDG